MLLRDVRPADSDQLLAWRNRADIRENMYTDHIIGEEEHRRWFSAAMNDPTRRYWIITDGAKDVGLANLAHLSTLHGHCSWAFYLGDPESRGTGVAAIVEFEVIEYVFDTLHLHKLWCDVLASNSAVIRGHERFGFKRDGLLRDHVRRGEQFIDVVTMSLVHGDWLVLRPDRQTFVERLHKRMGAQPA